MQTRLSVSVIHREGRVLFATKVARDLRSSDEMSRIVSASDFQPKSALIPLPRLTASSCLHEDNNEFLEVDNILRGVNLWDTQEMRWGKIRKFVRP